MRKRIRQIGGILLSLAVVCSVLALPEVYAAPGIETNKTDCQITVDLTESAFRELKEPAREIRVHLYKVASVSAGGKYQPDENFADALKGLENVSDQTTAEEWETFAAAAKAVIDNQKNIDPTAEISVHGGKGTARNLGVGLYLIDTPDVLSKTNRYLFTPYLASLPGNNYSADHPDDSWVYELTVGLKPEKKDLFGKLIIEKTLSGYNESLKGATFVFQIEAEKKDVDTEETRKVYSDVVSMNFQGSGTQSLIIEKIPAGAVVTVTEVYSGAGYELDTEKTVQATIVADEVVSASQGEIARVSFKNIHKDGTNGGGGTVNHFTYENGEWNHMRTDDSMPNPQ